MHIRTTNRGINRDQFRDLVDAWEFAQLIGLPLNRLITTAPSATLDLGPRERSDLFAQLRNRIGVFCRSHKLPAAFVWSREAAPDGTGEHFHALIHVPAAYAGRFDSTARGWLPEGAIHIRPANHRKTLSDNGRWLSAVAYVGKQLLPAARWRSGYLWQAGGPVLGKRCGVSAPLSATARAAYSAMPAPKNAAHLSPPP